MAQKSKRKPAQDKGLNVALAIQQHAAGRSLRDIAKAYGMTYEGLRLWLLDEQPEQYRDAQRIGLIKRIVEADTGLEGADTMIDIARAREVAKFVRWDAERRLPQLFAQKQEVKVTSDYTAVLDRLAEVIEGEAEQVDESSATTGLLPKE